MPPFLHVPFLLNFLKSKKKFLICPENDDYRLKSALLRENISMKRKKLLLSLIWRGWKNDPFDGSKPLL